MFILIADWLPTTSHHRVAGEIIIPTGDRPETHTKSVCMYRRLGREVIS
jgi:hypothetical protein